MGYTPQLPSNETRLDKLQEYYNGVVSNENSECKMEECFAELTWNYSGRWIPSDDTTYEHLVFSLHQQGNLYILTLTGGSSFPENSWGKKQLESAVAKAYLSGDTGVIIYGEPDINS